MDPQQLNESAPQDRSLSRAERRRLAAGKYEGAPGAMSCKFCKSTRGTYIKMGNRFICQTKDCKGNTHATSQVLLEGGI